eukprot:c29050_g1_i1 orf=145-336(+)
MLLVVLIRHAGEVSRPTTMHHDVLLNTSISMFHLRRWALCEVLHLILAFTILKPHMTGDVART